METKTKIVIMSILLLIAITAITLTIYIFFFRNENNTVNIIKESPIEDITKKISDETEYNQASNNIGDEEDTQEDSDDEEDGPFVSSDNSDYSVGYRKGNTFKPKYKKWVCDKAKNIIDNETVDDSDDDDILGSCEFASAECKKYATCTSDSDVKSGCSVSSYDKNGVETLFGCPSDCCKEQVKDINEIFS